MPNDQNYSPRSTGSRGWKMITFSSNKLFCVLIVIFMLSRFRPISLLKNRWNSFVQPTRTTDSGNKDFVANSGWSGWSQFWKFLSTCQLGCNNIQPSFDYRVLFWCCSDEDLFGFRHQKRIVRLFFMNGVFSTLRYLLIWTLFRPERSSTPRIATTYSLQWHLIAYNGSPMFSSLSHQT